MALKIKLELDEEQKRLYRATAGDKEGDFHAASEAARAREAWAASFGEVLRKTLPIGSTVRNIYEVKDATNKRDMVFYVEPNDVEGWTAPSIGTFSKNYIQGDLIYIPWQQFASSVYYSLDFARDADFDVPSIAVQKLNDSLLRLEEYQGWHLIRVAVNNADSSQRIAIADGTPGAGYFSKQLFSAMAKYFERLGKTPDAIYIPATAMADVRSWITPQIDPVTQKQIFDAAGITRIYNINLITIPLIHYYKTVEDKKNHNRTTLDRLFDPKDKKRNGSDVWTADQKNRYANGQFDVCYAISKADFGIYAIRENIKTVNDPIAIRDWEQGILARFSAGFAIIDSENICMGIVDRTFTEFTEEES